jgi:hypothetical protein
MAVFVFHIMEIALEVMDLVKVLMIITFSGAQIFMQVMVCILELVNFSLKHFTLSSKVNYFFGVMMIVNFGVN